MPEHHPQLVGKRIALLRERERVTQADFAAAVGVPRPAVSNWESGRQRPGFEAAEKIASVYGVTLDWLFLDRRETLRHAVFQRLYGKGVELS